jgi:serine O-acetyltransferase
MNPLELWPELKRLAQSEAQREPILSGFLYDSVLRYANYDGALAYGIVSSLANRIMNDITMGDLVRDVLARHPDIMSASLYDLEAFTSRDPACENCLIPFLYYKGFKALQAYRVAHALWQEGRGNVARFLQSRIADVFAVDIHPAARVGKGVFLDHATAIVIGETAVVEDNVSIMQMVTLGGTGKEIGDRHPKIREGVLISVGAKVLGNIEVGRGAKVAAGSVVLHPVPPHATVAGVPAKLVGQPKSEAPALDMDQDIDNGGT